MRRNQGFTVIELLIVVAIIAIIAAIAIPNLLQARMRANESNAVTLMRQYVEAQQKFKEEKLGGITANSTKGGTYGYADNYANLLAGHPIVPGPGGKPVADTEKTLGLISREFSAARGLDGTPVHGYVFREPVGAGEDDVEVTLDPETGYAVADEDNFWAHRFALLAVPYTSGRTGAKAFYIDDEGVLMMKQLASGLRAEETLEIETPLKNSAGWVAY